MAKSLFTQLKEAMARHGLVFMVYGRAETPITIHCPCCGLHRGAFVLKYQGHVFPSYGACLNKKCRATRDGRFLFPVKSEKGRLVRKE